ncbi:MAG: potassium transporter Trk [Jiangellaceae bacterium]|jgi:hypothetical protein
MADVVFVLVIIAFFGLCALYVLGCELLIARGESAESAGDAVPEKASR